jgi:hypothetical protein
MEEWSTLFSLASQWEFDAVVKLATKELSRVANTVDKILLARKHPELECWLWDALCSACTLDLTTPFSLEDWRRLDKDDIILITMGREAYRANKFVLNESALSSLMKKTFGIRQGH